MQNLFFIDLIHRTKRVAQFRYDQASTKFTWVLLANWQWTNQTYLTQNRIYVAPCKPKNKMCFTYLEYIISNSLVNKRYIINIFIKMKILRPYWHHESSTENGTLHQRSSLLAIVVSSCNKLGSCNAWLKKWPPWKEYEFIAKKHVKFKFLVPISKKSWLKKNENPKATILTH